MFLEATKPQIQDILKRLYEDLTSKGESFIYLNESNVLTAKIFEAPKEPIDIFEHNVPILRYGRISQLNIPWDISLNYILNRIDGVSHIKKIASRKPPIDIECVKRCLRTLLFYDCVIISDAIQLSNVYQLTHTVQSVISDNSIMQEIQKFCCVDPEAPPGIHNIIKFLLKFRPGKQLSHILISIGVDSVTGIDIRRLIAIAQDYKIITRLHEYPVYLFKQQQQLQLQQGDCFHSVSDVKCHTGLNSILMCSEGNQLPSNSNNISPSHTQAQTGIMSLAPYPNSNPNIPIKEASSIQQINSMKNKKINKGTNSTSTRNPDLGNNSTALKDLSIVLRNLKGTVCLDSICCFYEISPTEILESQKYYIVYK